MCTSPQSSFLLAALCLLSALTRRCGGVGRADPSGLGATLRSTELVGAVSMLYGLLLQQGGAPRAPDTPPPRLAPPASCIAAATMALLVQVAELDLDMLQGILGAEGISLQLRHISAHLLWVCGGQDAVHPKLRDVLHRVIRLLGYFAVRNHDNQVVLQSGVQPTVLQQLCQLPFQYFSEPRLSVILFPTLIACCADNPENRAILEQELSYDLLEAFESTPLAEADKLMALIRSTAASSRASSACSAATRAASKTTLAELPDDLELQADENIAKGAARGNTKGAAKGAPKDITKDVAMDVTNDITKDLPKGEESEISAPRKEQKSGEAGASETAGPPPPKRAKGGKNPGAEEVAKAEAKTEAKPAPRSGKRPCRKTGKD